MSRYKSLYLQKIIEKNNEMLKEENWHRWKMEEWDKNWATKVISYGCTEAYKEEGNMLKWLNDNLDINDFRAIILNHKTRKREFLNDLTVKVNINLMLIQIIFTEYGDEEIIFRELKKLLDKKKLQVAKAVQNGKKLREIHDYLLKEERIWIETIDYFRIKYEKANRRFSPNSVPLDDEQKLEVDEILRERK